MLGKFGDEKTVDAFMSISNPFNVARTLFSLSHSMFGRFMLRHFGNDTKKLIRKQLNNQNFWKRMEL
jgi:predicted alpha/beta-fold hydrolase